jgi:alpha-D-xyloside xylohydrolase
MSLEPGFKHELKSITNTDLEKSPYLDATTNEIRDQYMAGEYLLVAPMFTGQISRKVVLPKGKWYDFYTGMYAGDGEIISVTPGLDKIPVYVKDGAIIPMMPPLLYAPKAGQRVDIEIRHYGEKPGNYLLYDDDGETFNYEKGEYTWREIKVEKDKKDQWKGTITAPLKDKPNTVGNITWRFMTLTDGKIKIKRN